MMVTTMTMKMTTMTMMTMMMIMTTMMKSSKMAIIMIATMTFKSEIDVILAVQKSGLAH